MTDVSGGWAYFLMAGGLAVYFYGFALDAYRNGKRLVAGASASWATVVAAISIKMAMIPGFL